jgi:SecD/SecF fusion protein
MKKIVLIIFLCGSFLFLTVLFLVCLSSYLNHLAEAPLSKPPEHGTTFVVEASFSPAFGDTNMASLEKVLGKRFAYLGTRAFMEPVSASQLRISVPVTTSNDVEHVREAIIHSASLEFRLVNDQSEEILKNNWPIPPGYEVMQSLEMAPGQTTPFRFVVRKVAEDGLAGNFVQTARVVEGSLGAPEISFTLNPDAAKRFAEVTTKYSPDPQTGQMHFLAIVLDGDLYSAPYIKQPIVDGTCEIDGNFTDEEAEQLAQLLNNPLPVALKIVETKSY